MESPVRTLPTTADLHERLRGHLRHPALRRSIELHQHIAASVQIEAAERANRALKKMDLHALTEESRMSTYAEAISEYVAWLMGLPATSDLALLLDLEDRY